jgi:hypothetical protein
MGKDPNEGLIWRKPAERTEAGTYPLSAVRFEQIRFKTWHPDTSNICVVALNCM